VSLPSVVLIHNRYQNAGGEDDVFTAETALLRRRGHRVETYTADNHAITDMNRAALVARTMWNQTAYRDVYELCRSIGQAPVVAHFHNVFPLVSPAAYYGARKAGAVVVQTLHNYRYICPGATLFRDGRPCEACVGQPVAWRSVAHACYRQSRSATTVVATTVALHRALGTWRTRVGVYIALTEFSRRKFIEGGLSPSQVRVKANFLADDPGPGEHGGGFALYVGRLSPEKGIETLLDAWKRLDGSIPLKIVGTGPLERCEIVPGVEWLGWQPLDRVLPLMQAASFLVLPSTWYEGFPMTLVQAFAVGLPVIASAHGAMSEIVEHGLTGLHVTPGDPAALADRVRWAAAHPSLLRGIGATCRREFEQKYTADRNYERLMQIYDGAING
jgi:glycosyltransferase involved in cell wall biosynthesis